MNTPRMLKGTIIAITAAALLAAFIPSSAYAHDPGMPVPGMSRYGYLPGIPVPNLNDPRTANLVGSFLGTFLGTMIINNQYRDDNHHYYYDDRYRYRDRDYDYRYYRPYARDYYNRPHRERDRDDR